MKILMVIPQLFYSARGTPLSAYHRIRDLRAMGHEVEVLTYGIGDPPPDLPIVVHRARGPHFSRSLRQGPSGIKIWFDVLLLLARHAGKVLVLKVNSDRAPQLLQTLGIGAVPTFQALDRGEEVGRRLLQRALFVRQDQVHHSTSNRPAAPMPPPMHIDTTT